MTQLTQLKTIEQKSQKHYSKEIIQIETKVPILDYMWVKQNIREFIEENKLQNSLKDVSIYFTEQPIKKNIIKCHVTTRLKNKILTVSGQGMDEYRAVGDLLKNLELEVLLDLTVQTSKPHIFFSNSINQFQRGDQYA